MSYIPYLLIMDKQIILGHPNSHWVFLNQLIIHNQIILGRPKLFIEGQSNLLGRPKICEHIY